MKTFSDLRLIDVNKHIEKKGGFSYLSWTFAVDTLLQNDSTATWNFTETKYFGETAMVFCEVTALGKTMKMQLPVMDNRNNAVKNPDSRKISDAMMRCLVKCIATFGIGLYIYAGEDVPEQDDGKYRMKIGTMHIGKTLEEIGVNELTRIITAIESNLTRGKNEQEFIDEASNFIIQFENQGTTFK